MFCDTQQGIPFDIHMVKKMCELQWVPSMKDFHHDHLASPDGITRDYELCRAVMEGWFPIKEWGELNCIYAGLGQLLSNTQKRREICDYVTAAAKDLSHPLRLDDWRKFMKLIHLYRLRN